MDKRELIERIEVLEEWTATEDKRREMQDIETKMYSEKDIMLNKLEGIIKGKWEVEFNSHNSNIIIYFKKIFKLADERKVKFVITRDFEIYGEWWMFFIEEKCICSSHDIDDFIRKINNTIIRLNDGKIEV